MKIIFIVGASRSGTTMLNRVLGQHNQVLALNELHYFGDIWPLEDSPSPIGESKLIDMAAMTLARHYRDFWVSAPSQAEIKLAKNIVLLLPPAQRNGRDLFSAVMDFLGSENQCNCITEQTPRNVFYIDNLLTHYPNAYVVQLVRDPRAVLASQKSRWRRRWMGGKNIPITEAIRVWCNYHPVTMAKMWTKAAHIAMKKHHPRHLVIRYEDIVKAPEETTREICQFIQIPYQQDMTEVPQVGSSNRSNKENERGISSDSLETWKHQLTQGEIRLCEQIAGRAMAKFAYGQTRPPSISGSVLWQLLLFPVHVFAVVLSNPKRAAIQLSAMLKK